MLMYVCMYVRTYVFIHMYVCTYECVHIYACMCAYLCVCMMYVHMHICMHVCVYVRMYLCMYVCVCICMYVRMHVCIGTVFVLIPCWTFEWRTKGVKGNYWSIFNLTVQSFFCVHWRLFAWMVFSNYCKYIFIKGHHAVYVLSSDVPLLEQQRCILRTSQSLLVTITSAV
jgi:hypothetical protein